MSFTAISNHFIDNDMNGLSASAVVVYIAICRKTSGWQKTHDIIAASQFTAMTGLTKPTVIRAIRELVARGVINVTSSVAGNAYALSDTITIDRPSCCEANEQTRMFSGKDSLPVDVEAGKKSLPVPVKNLYQQKKQKKTNNKTHDARLETWPFVVYRRLTHLNVPFAYRDAVAELTNEAAWTAAITKWIGRGYRPNAIQGMLEWYEKERRDGRQVRQDDGRQSTLKEYIEANQHFME
jgi:phage replication O-like protein O